METLRLVDKIEKIQLCPPAGACKRKIRSYRFVHEDQENENNFKTPAEITPTRKFRAGEECSGHAMSCFDSQVNAKSKFESLRRKFPKIGKMIGTHLAVGTILPVNGLCTSPSRSGHFDFFEFDSSSIGSSFKWIGPISEVNDNE